MDTMMERTGLHLAYPLAFVHSSDDYSEYRSPTGEVVYLEHGTGRRQVPYDLLDLHSLWTEFLFSRVLWDIEEFRDHLRTLTIEPWVVEDVQLCCDCSLPEHDDDMWSTGSGDRICEGCRDNYYRCENCEELYATTTTTLSDTEVCEGCCDRYWSYCEVCDGYYHTEGGGHDHGGDCDGCVSPALSFSVRNDGEPPLANDTRVTVSLPAGTISAEGIEEIAAQLRTYALTNYYIPQHEHNAAGRTEESRALQVEYERLNSISRRLDEIGSQWQTKQGNFTKRLSRYAYNEFGYKIPQAVLSDVGNAARDHSMAVDLRVEVTRDLNLPREEFAHDGSCWWTDYNESRCALKTNGGFGLRTFNDSPDRWTDVSGRAWVLPMRQVEGEGMTPTFETMKPDAFVVFNGYGDLSGYAPARVMAHMAGWTYRKVGFECSPMYVNNSSGYLVAPEEIAARYTNGDLTMSVPQHANLFSEETKELAHV